MTKAYKNILFDLDGTISDSAAGIINAFEYAFAKMGAALPKRETLISYIGPPLEYSLANHFSGANLRKFRDYYREYYLDKGMGENVLYEGIEDLLASLKGQGYRLFVATCKATYNAKDVVTSFGIADYFEAIQGVEEGVRDKSDVIKRVMDEYRLQPKDTLFVGDTRHDTIGAYENNIDMCFVTYGFGKLESVSDLPTVYYAASPKAVGDYIKMGK